MGGIKDSSLGRYWSGCAGAVKRGLEILGFSQVAAGVSDARFLFAVQTIPLSTRGRTPFYLEHMKDKRDSQTAKRLRTIFDHRGQLLEISDILVGDSLFASYNFVTGATIRTGDRSLSCYNPAQLATPPGSGAKKGDTKSP